METMKTSRLKEQDFEWISFHDFVEQMKTINPEKQLWINGRAPNGRFRGHAVTLENYNCYIVGFPPQHVMFTKDDVLCFTKNNVPFLLRHPLSQFEIDFSRRPAHDEKVKSAEEPKTEYKFYKRQLAEMNALKAKSSEDYFKEKYPETYEYLCRSQPPQKFEDIFSAMEEYASLRSSPTVKKEDTNV